MFRCSECSAEFNTKPDYCDCGNDKFEEIIEKTSTIKPPKTKQSLDKGELFSRIFFVFCLLLSVVIWLIPVKTSPGKLQNKIIITEVKSIPDINKIWDDTPIYKPQVQNKIINLQDTIIPPIYQNNNQSLTQPVKKNYEKVKVQQNTKSVQKSQKSKPPEKTVSQSKPQHKTASNPAPKQEVVKQPELPKSVQITPKEKAIYNPNSPEMLKYKGELRSALYSKLPVATIQGSGYCSVHFSIDSTGKLTNRGFTQTSNNKTLNDAVYYMMMSLPKFSKPPEGYNSETIKMGFRFNNDGTYEISIY